MNLEKMEISGNDFLNEALGHLNEFKEIDTELLKQSFMPQHVSSTVAVIFHSFLTQAQLMKTISKDEFMQMMIWASGGVWDLVERKLEHMKREGTIPRDIEKYTGN